MSTDWKAGQYVWQAGGVSRPTEQDWREKKSQILDFYQTQDKTLNLTISEMKERGFNAT